MATPGDALPPDVNIAVPGLPIYIWIGCGLATVVVVARLITRLVIKKTAGWDDFFIGASYLTALVAYSGLAVLLAHGFGHEVYYISASDLIVIIKVTTAVNLVGFSSLAFARASIGIFLLRLVAQVRTWVWVLYFGLALNAIQAIGLIILNGLHCVPIRRLWDPSTSGICMPPVPYTTAGWVFGGLNVLVDFIFALFPLVLLRKLQIPRRVRVATYLLLSCGLLAAVCSIGRLVSSKLDAETNAVTLAQVYWAFSEISGVLILACMPAMHQLFHHIGTTERWKRVRTYLSSIVPSSKGHSHRITEVERSKIDTDSQKDLIFPQENIRVNKTVYVELSDRPPYHAVTPRDFGLDESSYQNSARASAGMV